MNTMQGGTPIKLYLLNLDTYDYIKSIGPRIYVSEEVYSQCVLDNIIDEETGEVIDPEYGATLRIANVSFISEDKTYFIANYEEGEKITYIPTPPERIGYTFGGWYKEVECINEWNFENDIVEFDENETIIRLYAKWE